MKTACVSDDTHFGPARKTLQVAQFENPCCRQSTDEVSPSSGKVQSDNDTIRTRLQEGLAQGSTEETTVALERGKEEGVFIGKWGGWGQLSRSQSRTAVVVTNTHFARK